jgi:DNA-binding IclR family transcriptional regulator
MELCEHGLARACGFPIPGIDAPYAPVFNSVGHPVLGILVMGPSSTFDNDWNGVVVKPLGACALEVSDRLGRDQRPA